jgi:hypothetical protein
MHQSLYYFFFDRHRLAAMTHPHFVACAAVVLAVALDGCAPDAWNSVQATGFNGYLKTIQVQCSPLLLGGQDMSWALQTGAGDNNYNYFLDQTSKLYYRRISPAGYSESLTAFFGAGYDRAISCVIAKLPAERP